MVAWATAAANNMLTRHAPQTSRQSCLGRLQFRTAAIWVVSGPGACWKARGKTDISPNFLVKEITKSPYFFIWAQCEPFGLLVSAGQVTSEDWSRHSLA